MCLIVNKENCNAKIADHDIICYKLMYGYKDDNGNVKIVSPYQYAHHPFNKTIVAKGRANKHNYYSDFKELRGGVIHSYSTLDGAVDDMTNFCDGNIIFKAIIPKGTKYYEGYFEKTPAYGSKKLIITDMIVGVNLYIGVAEEKLVFDYLTNNFKISTV